MDNDGPTAVKPVVHAQSGPEFAFLGDDHDWQWQDMVAQLRDEDIEWLLRTDRGPRAVLHCSVERRAGVKDVGRMSNGNAEGRADPQRDVEAWDFVLSFSDGHRLRLHPQYRDRRVRVYEYDKPAPTAPPGNARARCNKPWQKLKKENHIQTLFFDRAKTPRPRSFSTL